jgi:hypothetical protein
MDSFSGDVFSKKSSDVFNDYLDIKKGVPLSKPSFHLHKLVTIFFEAFLLQGRPPHPFIT